MLAAEPASTVVVVVVVDELAPVLAGVVVVVDTAVAPVMSAFVIFAVVGADFVEAAKTDASCLGAVVVDIAAEIEGVAVLTEKRTVGFENRRKPRDQKPVLVEAVRA